MDVWKSEHTSVREQLRSKRRKYQNEGKKLHENDEIFFVCLGTLRAEVTLLEFQTIFWFSQD